MEKFMMCGRKRALPNKSSCRDVIRPTRLARSFRSYLASLSIGIACGFICPAHSAPSTSCNSAWLPSLDYIICYDKEIMALSDEMDALYRASIAGLENPGRSALRGE